MTHKGWYSRGYLPHLDAPGVIQALTFRLADALPRDVLDSWRDRELEQGDILTRSAAFLDAGHGSCVLRDPRCAGIVRDCIVRFDGEKYRLIAWVVMPNHVHVVVRIREGWSLGTTVGGWKGASAREINRLLGLRGRLWQPGYFDRFIRDGAHLQRAVLYVHENPVKAGLVAQAEDWEFSSAGSKRENNAD